ncbi:MAG: hypothetical protein VB097_04215 [Rikenellaceae bacterium]|nr:hypothetical protein [Rikenellaceae bacterium]
MQRLAAKRRIPPLGGADSLGGKCRAKCNICFCSGFDEEFAVNSRGLFDDRREEFRRPAKNEEKSVKQKLRCTRRHSPRAEGTAMGSATAWK